VTTPVHPAPSTTISIANPSARRTRWRLPTTMVASRTSAAISHSILSSSIWSPRGGEIHRGLCPGTTIPRAVVFSKIVAVEALDPFGVTAVGETVQVPAWGAPPQLRLTV